MKKEIVLPFLIIIVFLAGCEKQPGNQSEQALTLKDVMDICKPSQPIVENKEASYFAVPNATNVDTNEFGKSITPVRGINRLLFDGEEWLCEKAISDGKPLGGNDYKLGISIEKFDSIQSADKVYTLFDEANNENDDPDRKFLKKGKDFGDKSIITALDRKSVV